MIYLAVICLIYFLICCLRLLRRYAILDSMEHIENLQANMKEDTFYFVMVEGMQYLELEKYIGFSRKHSGQEIQGIILNEEQYYHAEKYGQNFVVSLNIVTVPCIIHCINSRLYVIYDVDGVKEREVVLNE